MSLYVVASPIGNLNEITPRAVQVLTEVDIIAAEDTRNTRFLLERLNIPIEKGQKSKIVSYHKFNERTRQDSLIEKLLEGKSIALISDAGTPCISDPGYLLVKAAVDSGIEVIGVSGPCAAILALSVSGFVADPFLFVGFLPRKEGAIMQILKQKGSLSQAETLVFYESPKRIVSTITLFEKQFPNMKLCLCNDLTKKFERIYRGSPTEVLAELTTNPHSEKGEYTCVAHFPCSANDDEKTDDIPSLESLLIDVIVKTGCSMKEAIKILAKNSDNINKNDLYAASLRLKEVLK